MSTQPSTTFPEGFWDWEEERREQWVEEWIVSTCRNVSAAQTFHEKQMFH